MADHVDIGGLTFCLPAHGVAVRVEVRTPTQTLVVTDLVQRASWQQGGAYDAGSPWYSPTANPCELTLDVGTDLRWDPTIVDAYDLEPLATTVRVTLAEQATFGTWASQHRFFGPMLGHTYEPQPGGRAVVQITAADALTNLGDMIAEERPNETPYERLNALAAGCQYLVWGFNETLGAGPMLGRYHPDLGMTRLELMVSTGLTYGAALMFQPTDVDEPDEYQTIVYDLSQSKFSNPGLVYTAAVDPEQGMNLTHGDVAAWGANNRVACITEIELARQDAGFRTRVRSGRVIAPWTITVNRPGPASVPQGNHYWQSPSFTADAGDKFELHTQSAEPLRYGGANPTFRAMAVHLPSGAQTEGSDVSPRVDELAWENRYGYEAPPELTGNFVLGRYWIQPSSGVTMTFPASYTETVHRLGGTGDEIETVLTARETSHGQRAIAGWRSPILKQTELTAWNSRALGWITGPSWYPSQLRVASTVNHPSPGSQQWAVQLRAGSRLALRHHDFDDPSVLIRTWAVNLTTTLTPTELVLDVECGPLTSGAG